MVRFCDEAMKRWRDGATKPRWLEPLLPLVEKLAAAPLGPHRLCSPASKSSSAEPVTGTA